MHLFLNIRGVALVAVPSRTCNIVSCIRIVQDIKRVISFFSVFFAPIVIPYKNLSIDTFKCWPQKFFYKISLLIPFHEHGWITTISKMWLILNCHCVNGYTFSLIRLYKLYKIVCICLTAI